MNRFIFYNPNPSNKSVGDCVVRAVSKALNIDWYDSYGLLCERGRIMNDMPNANAVWGDLLKTYGFKKFMTPNSCPNCYTVLDFCIDHPRGKYVLATGSHVLTCEDGFYFDSWDSGFEPIIYYYKEV